jgi:S1-C subfamily serine protease
MYDLPSINSSYIKSAIIKIIKNNVFRAALSVVLFVVIILLYVEFFSVGALHNQVDSFIKGLTRNFPQLQTPDSGTASQSSGAYVSQISYEQAIIDAVKSASPSVVSIVISKNLPVYEQQFVNPFSDVPGFGFGTPFNFQIPQNVQKGTKYQEVGAGSGFIVSQDGLVLTNKHVVSDKEADYTVVTSDGEKYTAKVLALDPVQDLAIIKIQIDAVKNSKSPAVFPAIKIGDSSGVQIGQGAIAIGNALGQFSNTVSVGIVSGLSRSISASGGQGFSETLEDVIQTDAAINSGNSGGPLLNLKGEVIGVNTAMANGAQSIGFAIPINIAKKDITQIMATNKITYPFLGVRYLLVDDQVKEKYHLSVDYGALVLAGQNGEAAITQGSAADKAGIKEKDVVLQVNGEKITPANSLQKIMQKYSPNDNITLKVLRADKEINIDVVLGERN